MNITSFQKKFTYSVAFASLLCALIFLSIKDAAWDLEYHAMDTYGLLPSNQEVVDTIRKELNISTSAPLTMDVLQTFLHRFATRETTACVKQKRFGKAGGGGYDLCLDPPYRPGPEGIIYSFGIKYDFSFDDAVHNEFNCEVHSFDPSMDIAKTKKEHPERGKMKYHHLGLDGADFVNANGWQLKTLASVKKQLGHSDRIIDVLKIDIELSEWPALRNILLSGEYRKVKMLMFEMHNPVGKGPLKQDVYFNMFRILMALEKAGFQKYLHYNKGNCNRMYTPFVKKEISGTRLDLSCYELFYINSRFMHSRAS